MSIFVILIVSALVVLFASLSLLPVFFTDSDNDSLVQLND